MAKPNPKGMWRGAAAGLVALGCAAWCVPRAEAQRAWYVAPSGSDLDNECQDAESPCATIAYALSRTVTNTIQAGDALHLAAGVYTEAGLQVSRNLEWIGAGVDLTIIQAATETALATDRVVTVVFNASVRMTGVTVRHGRTPDGGDDLSIGGAGGNGGGILVNGELALFNSRVVSNETGRGGAGETGGRGGDGGGIYADGSLLMSNVVVAHNRTGAGGHGTQTGGRGGHGWGVHNSGSLEIHHSTIHHHAGGDGGAAATDGGAAGNGAIWNSGSAVLRTSTVSDNTGGVGGAGTNGIDGAASSGGAWWNSAAGQAVLAHATLASNEAGLVRGIYNDGGTVSLDHVIVGQDSEGEIDLVGPALLEESANATLTGALDVLITGVDPLLGELAMWGGETPVRRLKPLSPAVNAGDPEILDPPATDQRGAVRIQGGRIDLGAYELQPATLHVGEGGADGANECREAGSPCATFSHAIPQALPGDTIQVATGTIMEAGVLLDRSLTIAGAGALYSIWEGAAAPGTASDRLLDVLPEIEVHIRDLTFRHGRAPDGVDAEDGANGGAIHNEGDLRVLRCSFIGNQAGAGGPDGGAGGKGGAIYNNAALFVDECRFISNAAGAGGSADGPGGSGGGVYNDSAIEFRNTAFHHNGAGSAGGDADGGFGGALFNAGLAMMESSTLAWNQAGTAPGTGSGGAGGGIFNEDTLAGTNVTISGNITGPGGRGGGVANQGLLALHHSTIANNSAEAPDGTGGGISAFGLETLLNHVLLSDNAADGDGPDVEGEIESDGYNLISDSAGLVVNGNTTGNLLDVSGALEPLADNGGATWTHGLANESPAREAGNAAFAPPPETDQRGFPRRVGPRIDIGALEAALADSDGDGLPDYWEDLHGLDRYDPGITNVNAGAFGDPDGDLVDNWSEYVAGTSPIDEQSVFRVVAMELDGNVTLQFPSSLDRLYTLETASLQHPSPAWTDVPGQVDLPGSGGTDSVTHAAASNDAAYRVSVRLP